MAQQNIVTGSAANDGTGDPLRTAFKKAEDNFIDLYDQIDNIPSFPFTSSATTPTQIVGGSNGELAILGVTGSIEATKNITASFIQIGNSITFKDNSTTRIDFSSGVQEFFVDDVSFVKLDGNNNDFIVNNGGNDIDFKAEGDAFDNLLHVDAGLNRVGIKTSTPQKDLHVNGAISASEYHCQQLQDGDLGLEVGQFFFTSSERFTNNGPFYNIVMVKE
tara:strand:+ start:285 stop:941 length:657 start_codon:yes stop_codon:yes gene_type:complete